MLSKTVGTAVQAVLGAMHYGADRPRRTCDFRHIYSSPEDKGTSHWCTKVFLVGQRFTIADASLSVALHHLQSQASKESAAKLPTLSLTGRGWPPRSLGRRNDGSAPAWLRRRGCTIRAIQPCSFG